MSKTQKYTVLHAQNIAGAHRSVGDVIELTDAQAQYLIGNAVALNGREAKPAPGKPASSKSTKG